MNNCLRVGTSNVFRKLGPSDVRKCGVLARRHTDICMFQEIKDDDFEPLSEGLGDEFALLGAHNPIAFRKSKLRLAVSTELPGGFTYQSWFKWHSGDDKIPTPMRGESRLLLKQVERPKLPVFGVSNGHVINKAWNGREKDPEIRKLRQKLWLESIDDWQWTVNTARRHGITMIWGGDFNRLPSGVPKFNTWQFPVAKHGIDQIYASDGRGDKAARIFRTGDDKVIDTPSDHHMVVGHVKLLLP